MIQILLNHFLLHKSDSLHRVLGVLSIRIASDSSPKEPGGQTTLIRAKKNKSGEIFRNRSPGAVYPGARRISENFSGFSRETSRHHQDLFLSGYKCCDVETILEIGKNPIYIYYNYKSKLFNYILCIKI